MRCTLIQRAQLRSKIKATNPCDNLATPISDIDRRLKFCYFAASRAMKSALNQHVLVLNRLWQAVNVCTARRALTLLFQGQAQVVMDCPDGSFRTFSFQEWRDVSADAPHDESIHAISFRIRVPRIILLFLYDRMPKKEVKFTRHNIFERDKNTCQYCGKVFDRSELLQYAQIQSHTV
jgi:5-methylcytosine-specific restriction endonuclease McrA